MSDYDLSLTEYPGEAVAVNGAAQALEGVHDGQERSGESQRPGEAQGGEGVQRRRTRRRVRQPAPLPPWEGKRVDTQA
jgi:hypothetical protein